VALRIVSIIFLSFIAAALLARILVDLRIVRSEKLKERIRRISSAGGIAVSVYAAILFLFFLVMVAILLAHSK